MNMNKKLLTILGSVGAAVVLPLVALAAFNTVQFTANTNIFLTDGIGSATLIVTSTSQVASATVVTSSIAIDLESGSAITFLMATPTRRTLLVTPAIATFVCDVTTSTLNLTSASTQTVTVTMGDTCIQNFVATAFQPGQSVTVPLAWNGSSTFYSITTTLASNGSFVSFSTTSLQEKVVTGLTCGTIYVFTVRGATNDVESNTVSGSARTQLCPAVAAAPSGGSGGGGGGGVTVAPAPTPAQVTTTTPAATTTVASTTTPATVVVAPPAVVVAPSAAVIAPPSPAELLVVPQAEVSNIIFLNLPKTDSIVQGKPLSFRYQYTNRGATTQSFSLTREVASEKNKVVSRSNGTRNIKAGKAVIVPVNLVVSKSWKPGLYKVRVKVMDKKGKKILDQNSFTFKVVKPAAKKK